jgi:hypothetical protein
VSCAFSGAAIAPNAIAVANTIPIRIVESLIGRARIARPPADREARTVALVIATKYGLPVLQTSDTKSGVIVSANVKKS